MPADVIVTIRMPASLTEALKKRRESDYYSDLSEQVRSVVRKGTLKYLALLNKETSSSNPTPSSVSSPASFSSPTSTSSFISPSPSSSSASQSERDERIEALLAGMRELLKGGDR